MHKFAVMFVLLCLLQGCSEINKIYDATEKQKENAYFSNNPSKELVRGNFATNDGKNIVYSFYENSDADFGVIVLHMLDRDRNDWNAFAKLLQNVGYSVLAIDLRGHGDSTMDWRWRSFADTDFKTMMLDVNASIKFFAGKNVTNTILMGASIGANTALNYGIKDNAVKAIVLLSPGFDYRTVKIYDAAEDNKKPLLVIASEDDLYSFETAKYVYSKSRSKIKDYQYYKTAGHGTDIFKKEKADLLIIDWLVRNGLR